MTDLHCHILPKMDDGSKDVETSIKLLQMEKEQGVEKIVFTPHFHCDDESVDSFLERRGASFKSLIEFGDVDLLSSFDIKFGAEVYFSPTLYNVDLESLCFTDTSYLLLELPFTMKPQFLRETLYDIASSGITPIIAHVERYPYILEDITQIYDWVEAGYVVQTNASTLVKADKTASLIRKLVSWDLIHAISSDTHSEHKRPPCMSDALAAVNSKLGEDIENRLIQNGDYIFDNYELSLNPYLPRKILGKWR